jgi:hypothetical protein
MTARRAPRRLEGFRRVQTQSSIRTCPSGSHRSWLTSEHSGESMGRVVSVHDGGAMLQLIIGETLVPFIMSRSIIATESHRSGPGSYNPLVPSQHHRISHHQYSTSSLLPLPRIRCSSRLCVVAKTQLPDRPFPMSSARISSMSTARPKGSTW